MPPYGTRAWERLMVGLRFYYKLYFGNGLSISTEVYVFEYVISQPWRSIDRLIASSKSKWKYMTYSSILKLLLCWRSFIVAHRFPANPHTTTGALMFLINQSTAGFPPDPDECLSMYVCVEMYFYNSERNDDIFLVLVYPLLYWIIVVTCVVHLYVRRSSGREHHGHTWAYR